MSALQDGFWLAVNVFIVHQPENHFKSEPNIVPPCHLISDCRGRVINLISVSCFTDQLKTDIFSFVGSLLRSFDTQRFISCIYLIVLVQLNKFFFTVIQNCDPFFQYYSNCIFLKLFIWIFTLDFLLFVFFDWGSGTFGLFKNYCLFVYTLNYSLNHLYTYAYNILSSLFCT